MACTTFTCPTCGPYTGNCCPTCQPAQSIFQGECQDPGTQTIGRFLSVLDYKFCRGRLTSGAGFLVSNINGSGNAGFTWTTTPQVQLSEMLATANQTFGNLVVMGSDYRWRYLQGPASLGLFLQTDANGMLFFGDPPAATVPDPLAINDLSVANAATINDLTTNGTVTLNNIGSGTVVNLLGLDASNELVTQSLTSSLAFAMFYEESTSPSANAPNKTAANGAYLTIGNRLYDSGANIITVTTSQALTVQVAGKYQIDFEGLCFLNANSKASISLEINGVIVNNAGRTDAEINQTGSGTAQVCMFSGFEARNLSANDVIKLQLGRSGTVATYNVRLRATKVADL